MDMIHYSTIKLQLKTYRIQLNIENILMKNYRVNNFNIRVCMANIHPLHYHMFPLILIIVIILIFILKKIKRLLKDMLSSKKLNFYLILKLYNQLNNCDNFLKNNTLLNLYNLFFKIVINLNFF